MINTRAVLERVKGKSLGTPVGRFFSQNVDQVPLILSFLLTWKVPLDCYNNDIDFEDLYVFCQLGCSRQLISSLAVSILKQQMARTAPLDYELYFTYGDTKDFPLLLAFRKIPMWDVPPNRLMSVMYALGTLGDCETFARVRLRRIKLLGLDDCPFCCDAAVCDRCAEVGPRLDLYFLQGYVSAHDDYSKLQFHPWHPATVRSLYDKQMLRPTSCPTNWKNLFAQLPLLASTRARLFNTNSRSEKLPFSLFTELLRDIDLVDLVNSDDFNWRGILKGSLSRKTSYEELTALKKIGFFSTSFRSESKGPTRPGVVLQTAIMGALRALVPSRVIELLLDERKRGEFTKQEVQRFLSTSKLHTSQYLPLLYRIPTNILPSCDWALFLEDLQVDTEEEFVKFWLTIGGKHEALLHLNLSDEVKQKMVLRMYKEGKLSTGLIRDKYVVQTLYTPHILPSLLKKGQIRATDVFAAIRKKWVKYADLEKYVFDLDMVSYGDVLEYRPLLLFTPRYFSLLKSFHVRKPFPFEFFFPPEDPTKLLRDVFRFNDLDGIPIVAWIQSQVKSNSQSLMKKGVKRKRDS